MRVTDKRTHTLEASRVAAFLCFLSAHRLFTKKKKKSAFPLASVADAQRFDPGNTSLC